MVLLCVTCSTHIMHPLCSVASSLNNTDTASKNNWSSQKISQLDFGETFRQGMSIHRSVLVWCQWSKSVSHWRCCCIWRSHSSGSRHGRCTPGLPQFLNHTCQIVKTNGAVGDELPVGVRECCYPCAQGGWLCEEDEVSVERAPQRLIHGKHGKHGNPRTCWKPLNGTTSTALTLEKNEEGYFLNNMLDWEAFHLSQVYPHHVNSCADGAQLI